MLKNNSQSKYYTFDLLVEVEMAELAVPELVAFGRSKI